MGAIRGLREELGGSLRLVAKELEPGALKSDPVADPREALVGQVELKARLLVVRCCDLFDGFAIRLDGACLGRLRIHGRESTQVRAAHRRAPLDETDRSGADLRLIHNAHRHVGRCVNRCGRRCEEHRREHHCDESAMSHATYNIANS